MRASPRPFLLAALAFGCLIPLPATLLAADPEVKIVIKDHRFTPAEVTVPSGKRIRLVVQNDDATAEEFESRELKREKVIAGKSSAVITVGPLRPGRYPFVGEYHEQTARGVLIAQ